MSLIAFAMNGFLAVLLIAALVFGWRLERRLKALRDSHEGFAKAVVDLDKAAARAEQGLADLRAATDEAAETLAMRIERAQALAAQLGELVSRPLPTPTPTKAQAPTPQAPLERPAPRLGREIPPAAAPQEERRLSAADFERLLDREDRVERAVRGEPIPRPASRPGKASRQNQTPNPLGETPRSRARVDDDLFDGPSDGSSANPRAPRR